MAFAIPTTNAAAGDHRPRQSDKMQDDKMSENKMSDNAGFALFVISDLPEQENLKLASDLSPAIASHMASA
jgi:hypothetical protein